MELRGLEPLTPSLQSGVSARCGNADLAGQLSVSSHEIPLPTPANGTLNGTAIFGTGCQSSRVSWPVLALLWPPLSRRRTGGDPE